MTQPSPKRIRLDPILSDLRQEVAALTIQRYWRKYGPKYIIIRKIYKGGFHKPQILKVVKWIPGGNVYALVSIFNPFVLMYVIYMVTIKFHPSFDYLIRYKILSKVPAHSYMDSITPTC